MLLHQHRGGHAQHAGGGYHRAPGFGEYPAVEGAEDVAQAAEHVHAREHVRRRVRGPDDGHYPRAEVRHLHVLRAQVLAVRHQHVEYERRREGEHVVVHPAAERALVLEHGGYAHRREERVPDDIEYRKAGHERDVVVHDRVRDPVALRGRVLLNDEERDYVHHKIQREEAVPVRFNKAPYLAEQLTYNG